ncbi:MAG: tetratricopeptide repeat protein [Candidatus Paracaedimonas acanthamoebae]|uniref:Tetratricopeptide repeat protein n=1 Tax=Candidatus Paracaedimonas acanthamoebae TaxID=244581 RepID=A0A8J7PJG4_9PROT|nr:tetratricopeptide repeat protein [Candidatus Paracaedimonas acanthamoebae]
MKKLQISLTAMAVLMLTGCADEPTSNIHEKSTLHGKTLEQILAEKSNSEEKVLVKEGIQALIAEEYNKASEIFNIALVDDPTNSWLHTLNAMSYQLMARKGDISQLEIAEAGYNQALKFEPSNSIASLQLGRVKKQQKDFKRAQEEFANVLLIEPNNLAALYELASTSYYLGDIKTAQASIERYIKASPNKSEAYRAAGMIMAAAGKSSQANDYFKKYEKLSENKSQAQMAKRRIDEWKRLYDSGIIMLAQAEDGAAGDPNGSADASADPNAAASEKPAAPAAQAPTTPAQMVAIDAIVMRISELGTTTKGSNILENFSLTLAPGTHMKAKGHGIPGTVAGTSTAIDFQGNPIFPGVTNLPATITGGGSPLSVSRLFTQGVSFGSVSYSLNIANAYSERIKVLDRPSITTIVGKNAEFYAGTDLVLGLGGQYGGNISKTPTGITVKVTPLSLEGDRVLLEIEVLGSLTPDTTNNVTETFTSIQTSHVKTTVEMKLGETLMLGGINSHEDQSDRSGFPILQDIPGLQYFFSQETTSSLRKSVTYLITPRSHDKNIAEIQHAFNNPHDAPTNLTELEIRNKDWFTPYNNQVMMLKYAAPLYREFRTGDIAPVAWWQDEDFNEQITQIASFLYY